MDDNLEDEIGEECSKYGPISQITIFEATDPNFPADEAVRIFVQFERMESAMKAAIDLEGRFFGGRTVKAMFFSEAKFDRQELAPVAGQPDWMNQLLAFSVDTDLLYAQRLLTGTFLEAD